MIFATGGRASGATSTRSRPRSCAAANASSTVSTPSCAPSGAITRIGLIRICRLTRMRGVLLFGFSIARCRSPPRERKSGLQGDERLQVVSHDPGKRQMGAGRDEVCEKADPLTAALNQYRLVIGHVSGRREAADAGKGLRVAVDERERDRLEVGREVTRRRALVGVARELQLPPLD